MRPPPAVKRMVRPLLPRKIRSRRILGGPLRGSRIVTSWHDYPAALLGYNEASLLRWFAATVKTGETWLDVGAHYGYTALALARLVGPSGRVFAFEPVPETARCLAETRRLNHLSELRVITLGLSDCDEVAPMEVELVRGMGQPESEAGRSHEEISVVSLDRVWRQLAEGDERVQGVKVDVQGMELSVLKGMTALLTAQHPLLAVEFHHGVNRRAILQLLEACGYQPRGNPVEPERGGGEPRYADDHTYCFSVPL